VDVLTLQKLSGKPTSCLSSTAIYVLAMCRSGASDGDELGSAEPGQRPRRLNPSSTQATLVIRLLEGRSGRYPLGEIPVEQVYPP
jgi:hypothetical protein